MYAIIGILFLTKCVSSLNLNCTRLTTACPTAAQWSARGSSFNCSGHKSYVCLMASNAELREGCIYEVMILPGQTGCPYTKQCDHWTDQPLLVTENNYLPCPPDLIGCPPRNNSGYSILEIYKYPRCQGKNISDESSVSPKKTTYTIPNIPPARFPGDWKTLVYQIVILMILVTGFIICILKNIIKARGDHQQSGDALKVKFNANLDAENVVYNENVDISTTVVPSLYGNGSLSDLRQNNSGTERAEFHPCARQLSYQTNQETSQRSLTDVTTEDMDQDNIENMIVWRDVHTENDVYNGDINLTTRAVISYNVNGVPLEHTQDNSVLKNNDPQVVQHMLGTYSSSSDSDNSQTKMLKKTSKPTKRQSILQYMNSSSSSEISYIHCPNPGVRNPSDAKSRTQISEGNSVSNKLPDANKAVGKIRKMTGKREMAEKYSTPNTVRYLDALSEALEEYHQEN